MSLTSLLLLLCVTVAHSAVYYIDFENGNDANAGTAINMAWKTLPGTRKADDSGYVSKAFGGNVFSYNTKKVPAGTVFKLKRGTALDSSIGGWIQIDSLWYANGTAASPITIQADTNWGIGSIVINGSGMSLPAHRGLVNVNNIKHLVIDGAESSGIIVTNSTFNCVRVYGSGTNGLVLRNLELGYSPKALLHVYSDSAAIPTYFSDVVIDGIIAHDSTGTGSDTYSPMLLIWLNGFVVKDCHVYNSGFGTDGIHVGSSHNGWLLNNVIHDCGEQGIDLGRDGDYKTRDDSSNITVRACISYGNNKNNFDHNSGTHNIIWLDCFSWNTRGTLGDAGFNVHEGSAGPNWYINCSSSRSSDRGWNFGWGNNPWKIPGGTSTNRMINCISSRDSTNNTGSRGGSVWISDDTSTNHTAWEFVNCIFNTDSSNYGTVNWKNGRTIFTASDVQGGTGGWFGINCSTSSPLWQTTNSELWALSNETPGSGSAAINGGAWVFKTSGSGSSSATLLVTNAYGLTDATRIFRAYDWLVIEGALSARVVSVTAGGSITLDRPLTWSAGRGVWFNDVGTAPQIGASMRSRFPGPINLRLQSAE